MAGAPQQGPAGGAPAQTGSYSPAGAAQHAKVSGRIVRDLERLGRQAAKQSGADMVAPAHVDRAAEFLGAARTGKGWIATGAVAGIIGGAAGQEIFVELSAVKPSIQSLTIAIVVMVISLVLATIAIFRQ